MTISISTILRIATTISTFYYHRDISVIENNIKSYKKGRYINIYNLEKLKEQQK